MSWYYSINGGSFESKDKQSLRSFLDEVAAWLSDNDCYNYDIKELSLCFNSECMGVYDLPVIQAQMHLDQRLASYDVQRDYSPIYSVPPNGAPMYKVL